MDGPEGSGPKYGAQSAGYTSEPRLPQQIDRDGCQRPDQGCGQSQGKRRWAKQGDAQGDQVDVAGFAAVVGREKQGVVTAQNVHGVQTVEGFVAIRAGRPLTKPVEAQGGRQHKRHKQQSPSCVGWAGRRLQDRLSQGCQSKGSIAK